VDGLSARLPSIHQSAVVVRAQAATINAASNREEKQVSCLVLAMSLTANSGMHHFFLQAHRLLKAD